MVAVIYHLPSYLLVFYSFAVGVHTRGGAGGVCAGTAVREDLHGPTTFSIWACIKGQSSQHSGNGCIPGAANAFDGERRETLLRRTAIGPIPISGALEVIPQLTTGYKNVTSPPFSHSAVTNCNAKPTVV
eukprot:4316680-Pyramimonas_sp.AAC.1